MGVERHSRALVGEQRAYCHLGPLWMHVLQKLPINSDSFPPNCFILFLSAFLSSRCLGAALNNAEPGDGCQDVPYFTLLYSFSLLTAGYQHSPSPAACRGAVVGRHGAGPMAEPDP